MIDGSPQCSLTLEPKKKQDSKGKNIFIDQRFHFYAQEDSFTPMVKNTNYGKREKRIFIDQSYHFYAPVLALHWHL